MNELALFSGAGGGLLATQSLGFKTVCAVEFDEHCRCLLVQRQNDKHLQPPFPIWDDVCTFDGRPWRGHVDIVTGGFPCQAFSTAASGKNTADDLWPEMRRIVADVAPRYVFAENVSEVAINQAADDLEQMGYKAKAISFSAADLGADHIRPRHWLLAYANDKGELLRTINAKVASLPSLVSSIWQGDPGDARILNGLANRMDRFKATGNGQVPSVAIAAFIVLAQATGDH